MYLVPIIDLFNIHTTCVFLFAVLTVVSCVINDYNIYWNVDSK